MTTSHPFLFEKRVQRSTWGQLSQKKSRVDLLCRFSKPFFETILILPQPTVGMPFVLTSCNLWTHSAICPFHTQKGAGLLHTTFVTASRLCLTACHGYSDYSRDSPFPGIGGCSGGGHEDSRSWTPQRHAEGAKNAVQEVQTTNTRKSKS